MHRQRTCAGARTTRTPILKTSRHVLANAECRHGTVKMNRQ
jgi:hypothetical protein